jgi:DNA repair protein RadC
MASLLQTMARERPRERLRRLGPRALSLHELLSVLVGSGGSSGHAGAIAEQILDRGRGEVRGLARLSPEMLEAIPGVGPAVASRVAAALELGRRAAAQPSQQGERIRGPADVHDCLGPALRDLPHEEFHALLLNTQHRVIREVLITRGILDASLIHPREVFRPAVAEGAAAVILVHNHPSGDPTPSAEDRAVTRQLVDAGQALGIPVLDHVVIGDGRWCALGRGEAELQRGRTAQ